MSGKSVSLVCQLKCFIYLFQLFVEECPA